MRNLLIFLTIALFIPNLAMAKTIKIAVIDTGFDFRYVNSVKLCNSGHKDFSSSSLQDSHGHGTNIAGLIARDLKKVDYCLMILKFTTGKPNPKSIINFLNALQYAANLKPDIINISGGGQEFEQIEKTIVYRILSNGTKLIVASGNDGNNLDKNCNFFPACYYPEIIVVGNKAKSSNYGKIVDFVLDGNNQTAFGITMSGSSQSTAIHTNTVIKELSREQH